MKNHAARFLLIIAAASAVGAATAADQPVDVGRFEYEGACASCHGLDGKAHGPREMPVWGRAFNRQSSAFFENYPPQDSESAARSRILALTEYLYRLQGK